MRVSPDEFQRLIDVQQCGRIVQSNPEQSAIAKDCAYGSFCCLSHISCNHNWSWVRQMVTDDVREADKWWEEQIGLARVYYHTGAIRNAK